MKSKILKGVIVASAIAFVNCSDDSTSAPDFNNSQITYSSSFESLDLGQSSSSVVTLLESSSSVVAAPSSSSIDSNVPASSADVVAPTSSSDVALVSSSADVEKTSSSSVAAPASSAAAPASSSSDAPTSSATVESSSSEAPKPVGIFLAEGKEEEKDQMQVEYKENTGWDGKGILSYPKQLSSTQKHGVIVWGPGGGTEPGAYGGMIRRLASHGFVVIALSVSPGVK